MRAVRLALCTLSTICVQMATRSLLYFLTQISTLTLEYLRRLDAFTVYTHDNHVKVLNADLDAGMEEWLREVVFREAQRCKVCFNFRMDAIAAIAEAKGFDAFSTTLLYSRFQKHELLKQMCEAASEKHRIPFVYKDWRTGWNEGVKKYRKLGLYRQKYCGCVYSEKERALKIM